MATMATETRLKEIRDELKCLINCMKDQNRLLMKLIEDKKEKEDKADA